MSPLFPVKLNLRIDWSEMDMFGHVNNVMFLKYIQASRVNYWETIGLSAQFNTSHIGPILASVSCQFRKPLHYPGNIMVQASITWLKTSSFGIVHQILNADNVLVAEGEDVVVMYDFKANQNIPVPEWMRQKVSEIEQRKF